MTYDSSKSEPFIVNESAKLDPLDYVVIALYFVGVFIVGFWSSRKSKGDSVSGYFLADKAMHWIPVGASLFASNIGSGHFVGLAGSGAQAGIAVSAFEISAVFIILLLGWVFIPIYTAAEVYTIPEYIKKRFGGQRIRVYLSVLSLLLYIFTKISADLFAGAIFIKQSLNLSLYVSVCILLVISGIFTIVGGLTAIMWIDFVQTILMVGGALTLMILSLIEVGGYDNLVKSYAHAVPTNSIFVSHDSNGESCSKITEYYFNLFRPLDDPEVPWIGAVFGMFVIGTWYWCSDQVIVQRALSAKNISHAKGGCILAALCKFLPLYLLVIPGMASRVLWPNEIGCSNAEMCKQVCGNEGGCTNIAYPLLVLKIMPQGATGLMLSVMMASLMSSLTAIFNSASTIFTIDLWSRFRKESTELEQVLVGQCFVIFLVIVSIIWIPFVESSNGGQLFPYINSVTSYLAPPICAVYILAILWSQINEKGAFWGLMLGLVLGLVRFIMEFAYKTPLCGEPDDRPIFVSKIHYLHFGVILFIFTLVITILISLLTKPIDEKQLYRLTFWTRFSNEVREKINEPSAPKLKKDVQIYTLKVCNSKSSTYSFESINSTDHIATNNVNNSSSLHSGNDNNSYKWLYFICCLSSYYRKNKENNNIENKNKLTDEEKAVQAAQSIYEDPKSSRICNIGALIIFGMGCFFYGMYG